jgi:hypothetical protein
MFVSEFRDELVVQLVVLPEEIKWFVNGGDPLSELHRSLQQQQWV